MTCEGETEHQLHQFLMNGYNVNIIPLGHNREPVEVSMDLNLFAISKFDDKAELLGTNSFLDVVWTDNNLKWEPETYDNITSIYLKQEQVWLPDLAISNSLDGVTAIGYDELNVIVSYTGAVTWRPGLYLNTICEVNTKYFPFDEQECEIRVNTWSQFANKVRLIATGNEINLQSYSQNGQWRIARTGADATVIGFRINLLTLTITMQRRYEYYIMSVIFPVILMSVLNCLVAILPAKSGEKAGFSITVFLSFMVLMTFILDVLPNTSKNISIFVTYIGGMLGLSFISVIGSVMSHLHFDNRVNDVPENMAWQYDTADNVNNDNDDKVIDFKTDGIEHPCTTTEQKQTAWCVSLRKQLSAFEFNMFFIVSFVTVASTLLMMILLIQQ